MSTSRKTPPVQTAVTAVHEMGNPKIQKKPMTKIKQFGL